MGGFVCEKTRMSAERRGQLHASIAFALILKDWHCDDHFCIALTGAPAHHSSAALNEERKDQRRRAALTFAPFTPK
jgi:hypothetical protein